MTYRNPKEKVKFIDCNMKQDPPFWITADFDYRKTPVDNPQQKPLFTNNPVAVA